MTLTKMYELREYLRNDLAQETDPEMIRSIQEYLSRFNQRISNAEYENSRVSLTDLAKNRVPGK